MKTNFVRQASLALAVGLTLSLGCARPAAQSEQPASVVAPAPAPAVVAAPVSPAVVTATAPLAPAPAPAAVAAPAPGTTNEPAILESIPPVTRPEAVALSPGLGEVVKLAQAGVGEEVILTYVDKYSGGFAVGADQILYLNDLGVSGTVITAMLKHDGRSTAATPAPAAVQTQAVSNVPVNPVYAQAPAEPAPIATAVAPPSASPEVAHFYDSLSPYGSWIYVSGYGWCWQPTVAVSVPAWRPYSDRGRWYWSDAGWYWNSDYSWGWAPFHYGRWYHHGRVGWLWTPGTVWGPSWVSWRYSDGYCGWAPLPPAAYYHHGVGFTYHGSHVGIGFEFGLSDFHYSFVSIHHFSDYSPHRHFVPRTTVKNVYRNTTVINNYTVANNKVINRGIGRETVAKSAQTPIREVAVREAPAQGAARVRADQVERKGSESVVYRPTLPQTAPQIKTASFANRSGSGMSTVGRVNTGSATTAKPGVTQPGTPPSTVGRTSPGTSVGSRPPSGTPSEPARISRPAETPRSQPAVGTRNPVNTSPNVNTGQRTLPGTVTQPRTPPPQQQQPQTPPQRPQQTQPRAGKSLFGDSGANVAASANPGSVARSQPSVSPSVPRTQTAPTAPLTRAYPQTRGDAAQPQVQPRPQYQQPPAARVETPRSSPSLSPRATEQAPRSVAPTVRTVPQSAPATRSSGTGQSTVGRSSGGGREAAPARSSGGGRSDSGSGRERSGERGR